jgi:flagellar biogenesis protein FliO
MNTIFETLKNVTLILTLIILIAYLINKSSNNNRHTPGGSAA